MNKHLITFAVDKPWPVFPVTPGMEGTQFRLTANTASYTIIAPHQTPLEIEAFCCGPLEFRLVTLRSYDQILLLVHCDFGWIEAPYTWHRELPAERPMPGDWALGATDGIMFHLMVVDSGGTEAILRGQRLVCIGHDFSLRMLAAIHQQSRRPWSSAAYEDQLQQIYAAYPTTRSLANLAVARWKTPGTRSESR